MNLVTTHGGHKVDTNNVTQFQARHELHRHFADLDGPYKPRLTRLEACGVVLVYVASALVSLALMGYGYDVLKPDEWASIGELLGMAR